MKKTSLFENALIWFGAGVSIAEILTGTYLAPLGLKNGILAIVAGHVIGCILLFLAGVIGGKMRLSAMDSTKMSFGQKGCLLFAALNVLQLVGWTAIMIYDGALAADGIMHTGAWIWCLIIGILILVWIGVGITNLGKINTVAMVALFVLTLIVGGIVNYVISQLVDKTGLTGTDRVLGAAFGLIRGALIVAAILFFLDTFTNFEQTDWWKESKLIPHFGFIIEWFFQQLQASSSFLNSTFKQ